MRKAAKRYGTAFMGGLLIAASAALASGASIERIGGEGDWVDAGTNGYWTDGTPAAILEPAETDDVTFGTTGTPGIVDLGGGGGDSQNKRFYRFQ